jgi:hypothetical protein
MTEDLGRTPTEIPPADLGAVFGTGRAAGLQGMLRPAATPAARQDTPAQSAPAADASESKAGEEPAGEEPPSPAQGKATAPTRARRPRSTRPTRSAPDPGASTANVASAEDRRGQVVAYIPVSLKTRLRKAAVDGESYTTLTLAAIDAHKDELATRWTTNRRSGSAFVGWQRSRRRNEEQMVSMTIRLIPTDDATLDQFWQEASAPNRSAYIEAALDIHLPR